MLLWTQVVCLFSKKVEKQKEIVPALVPWTQLIEIHILRYIQHKTDFEVIPDERPIFQKCLVS